MTGVNLELLTDPDMYSFFEDGIRGGIYVVAHRYARANNKYLDDYDNTKPSKFIQYLDVNNLYGAAMSENLLLAGFEWMTRGELDNLDISAVGGDEGCVLEVDCEYPDHLHDVHNAYPLAPESMMVQDEMLSDYATKLQTSQQKTKKLIPNLYHKKNYIVHYKTLQLYMKFGLKVKTIHKGIKFYQTEWMKPYIDFNTGMRKKAKSDFEKDLFKLMNNAVFGKTMENVRKYREVKLVTNEAKAKKLMASPRFKERRAFGDIFAGMHMARKTVSLDKPIYCGFSILDMSKTYMYELHYGYMIPKYGHEKVKVVMTDTDSFICEIGTDDINKDMAEDADRFDFSNYPIDHALYSDKNKKVLGKMKDETAGVPIKEVAALRSKMYRVKTSSAKESKRAKGVRKATLKNDIIHDDYVNTLFTGCSMRHLMHSFRSENHQIYSVEENKISLSAFDDKRYLLDDGITSYAYGHNKIRARDSIKQTMNFLGKK
jgi:hypothetical protein